MPKTWSEWIALVGGLIALITAPVTITQCWQDRARLVIETEYANDQPIFGGTVQYGSAVRPSYLVHKVSDIPPSLPEADRKLIVTVRNLGRRPMHVEYITLALIQEARPPVVGQPKVIPGPVIHAERFDHTLAEDNRHATYVIDVPEGCSLIAVAVTDDAGEEHVLRIRPWPAGISKPALTYFKHL